MGRSRRRRRRRGRRQPGDDRARASVHHSRHHGHDDPARAGDPPRRPQYLRARLHALPELQHGRARAHQRHALHAGRGLGCGEAAGRQIAGAYPESAGRCRHSDRLAYRADAAHHRDVRRLQDSGAHGGRGDENPRGRAGDRGRRLLHARVRGGAGQDRQTDFASSSAFRPSASAPASAPTGKSCSATICSACSRISSRNSPSASPS